VRTTRLLAPLAATAILVAGCGSDDTAGTTGSATTQPAATATTSAPALEPNGVEKLSAAAIVTKAKKAARRAAAVHIKGDTTDNGGRIRFDMHLLADKGGTGTLTVQGGTVQIIRAGRQVYMRGSKAFWTAAAGPGVAELVAGRYLKMPASDKSMAGLIAFTDLDQFMTELLKQMHPAAMHKGAQKDAAGRRAITVTEPGADGGILYVALDGKPYPLRMESLPGSKDEGKVEFLDYDKPFTLRTPPASQTIDISKLKSG
jgi:hypothetical protein